VQLDQCGASPLGVISLGRHLKHVTTIASTQAQHPNRSRDLIEHGSDVSLNLTKSPGQIRVRVVVRLVPLQVVAHASSIDGEPATSR
jgi:hypothetical protein